MRNFWEVEKFVGEWFSNGREILRKGREMVERFGEMVGNGREMVWKWSRKGGENLGEMVEEWLRNG